MEMKWIKLAPATLNTAKKRIIRGVDVDVSMSPYDVPLGVTGRYDKLLGRFVIGFEYISADEPREPVSSADHVTLEVGKHSDRLYGIEIDVDAMGAEAVSLRVNHAIEDLAQQRPKSGRLDNYTVAKEIISEKASELFAELPA